ncbi:MAG TPA: MdtA/MuxA family multidrug efflux RND transporter periplasmic adaptor subunit [Bryobacteraceae bacterium]|jgi:multidrug efflux system membrane fusion protein|nr:MdtA/MuxA family multidrug efflux RND transporter periplasmic adaptor subunit [Bryobacteraceae bacterium]
MTTNTTPTDLHHATEEHRIGAPGHPGSQKPESGKPKRRGLIWAIFFVVILAVGGYAVWRASQPGLVATPQGGGGRGGGGRGRGGFGPTPVEVAKATRKAVPVYLNGLGNVAAFYTVTVKSRVDGQLMSVNFKEGDLVEQGQLLAEIDPRPYQVQEELAEGTLARDMALLANARVDLDRYKTLLAQDAVPKQQLDTQVALVAQYEGNIKQDTANVNSAKLNLIYAKITAPITGRIGLRLVDPGNIVHAADANGILVITQLDPIAVLFTIPEDTLPQVLQKLRAGIHLQVDAYNRDNSQKLATGELQTVDNQIDQSTGTSKLKAVFDNKNGTLFPNQFVNVKLLVETMSNQLVIPTVAVQNGQQGTFVYVVDNAPGSDTATVHLRTVQVLSSDQSGAVIKSGLEDGEQVAVDGADRLQDGVTARVRKAGEAEAEAAADAAAMQRGRGRGRKGGDSKGKKGGPGGPGGRSGGQ